MFLSFLPPETPNILTQTNSDLPGKKSANYSQGVLHIKCREQGENLENSNSGEQGDRTPWNCWDKRLKPNQDCITDYWFFRSNCHFSQEKEYGSAGGDNGFPPVDHQSATVPAPISEYLKNQDPKSKRVK